MNTKTFQHPLESVFGMGEIEQEMDIAGEYAMITPEQQGELVAQTEPTPDLKDEDDLLVEKRIDEVYDAAMETFQAQTSYMAVIEPRYAARNAEVAASYLNIALAAANSRAKVKTDRKRANQTFIPHGNGKTTNNLIIADRNEILKMIDIDGTKKEF